MRFVDGLGNDNLIVLRKVECGAKDRVLYFNILGMGGFEPKLVVPLDSNTTIHLQQRRED